MKKIIDKAGEKRLSLISVLVLAALIVATVVCIFSRVNAVHNVLFYMGTFRGDIVLLELLLFVEGYLLLFFVDARFHNSDKRQGVAFEEE